MQEREKILSGKEKKRAFATRSIVVSLDRADAFIAGGEEAIGWRTLLALSCEGRSFRPARRTKLASGEGFQGTCLKVVRLNRCFIPQASE